MTIVLLMLACFNQVNLDDADFSDQNACQVIDDLQV